LVFLDISATEEQQRKTLIDLVRKVASTINIPLTVGAESSVADVEILLQNGADKVSLIS
jgi:cyclase